jgi:triphosphoribosyl-dephospho-CoA synthase
MASDTAGSMASTMASTADRLATFATCFRLACQLDVLAMKPGNVSLAAAGHRMVAEDFLASAAAAVPGLTQAGARVGARIEAAMRATLAAVGCNTNLGIVLLAAPLALAWESRADYEDLPAILARVLAGLDREDAAAAFRAIALTQPGGLSQAPAHDVHRPPEVDLRLAMAAAAHRDRIAALYAPPLADAGLATEAAEAHAAAGALNWRPYRELFEVGLPAWRADLDASGLASSSGDRLCRQAQALVPAMQGAYLALLAAAPDTHIVRKHGPALAHSVMTQAQAWQARRHAGQDMGPDPQWQAWDQALKQAGINPGTCADLAVGTSLLALLLAA